MIDQSTLFESLLGVNPGMSSGDFAVSVHTFIAIVKQGAKFGLGDWLPKQPLPADDSFCAINRSGDPSHLAGVWYQPKKEDNLLEYYARLIHVMRMGGGDPDYVLLPPKQYQDLFNILNPQKYAVPNMYISVSGIKCLVDVDLTSRGYLVQTDAWHMLGDILVCTRPGHNARIEFDPTEATLLPPVCECGSQKIGATRHSSWCPIKSS